MSLYIYQFPGRRRCLAFDISLILLQFVPVKTYKTYCKDFWKSQPLCKCPACLFAKSI